MRTDKASEKTAAEIQLRNPSQIVKRVLKAKQQSGSCLVCRSMLVEIFRRTQELACWTRLLAVDRHPGSRRWMMICGQPGQPEQIGQSSLHG